MVTTKLNGLDSQQTHQRGVFSVEFAIVGVFIALILAFISDMVGKQNLQGHLQRLSYSAVNVIKERTQLYAESEKVETEQVDQIFNVVSNSMGRSMAGFEHSNFAMLLEQLRFEKDSAGNFQPKPKIFPKGSISCAPAHTLNSQTQLHIETSWGRKATLYQVTLCYEGDNWFGNALGDGSDYSRVVASSLMLGR